MVCKDGAIARYTTPSVMYTPSQVEMHEVDEIFLVVSPNGTRYKITVSNTGTLTTTAL